MERYVDKVAIVTGASSGIGAAVSKILVQKGLKVIGLARRVERIEELACSLADQPGVLFPLACDVSNEANILECFKWVSENVGPIHILINNAGFTKPNSLTGEPIRLGSNDVIGAFLDGATEEWREIFDVNVLGLCICTREALKVMKENGIDGHIVHLNSIAGHNVPSVPNFNVYPASKYAVTALAETLRQELNREHCKIKVSSISPGLVRTEFEEGFDEDTKAVVSDFVALTPVDVAEAIIFVLSTPPTVGVTELTIKAIGELF